MGRMGHSLGETCKACGILGKDVAFHIERAKDALKLEKISEEEKKERTFKAVFLVQGFVKGLEVCNLLDVAESLAMQSRILETLELIQKGEWAEARLAFDRAVGPLYEK